MCSYDGARQCQEHSILLVWFPASFLLIFAFSAVRPELLLFVYFSVLFP
jgi:hypothetical protein